MYFPEQNLWSKRDAVEGIGLSSRSRCAISRGERMSWIDVIKIAVAVVVFSALQSIALGVLLGKCGIT